uniref:Uncharacterized protein n=1 Tax=viral metagenome TaxID=1070528 RepID=A0A6C0BNT5_9ZZZZ
MTDNYLDQEIRKQIDIIVMKALQLPLARWLEESRAAGYKGIFWFKWQGVRPGDLRAIFPSLVDEYIDDGYELKIHNNHNVTVTQKGSGPQEIFPLLRAVLHPYD